MKNKLIKIDNINIGYSYPTLIIPEIGINHNGSLKKAIQMVDSIKLAGANCVKVQIHIPDEEMSEESKKISPGNSNKNIYHIIKSNSLNLDEELALKRYIEKKNLLYIATPFSIKAIHWLKKNNVKIIKIGSGEFNNEYFIQEAIKIKIPMILSTGMQDAFSIKKTFDQLKRHKSKFVILHCHSVYPTLAKYANLNQITSLKKKYKNELIGYSDHTIGTDLACASLSFRPVILEKHFTLSKNEKGPDIICSIDKNELKYLLKASNNVFLSLNYNKKDTLNEKLTKKFAFQSVVASVDIKKGEFFSNKNTILRRPGTGQFNSRNWNKILGLKSKFDIKANTQIKKKYVSS
ncbi:N-acetylneuraminate synthase family protein [Alphaproteobacteria bacterium]|nr:N-acetylneuraminate synthase family protein [Alphaproteobacteria bacterium]